MTSAFATPPRRPFAAARRTGPRAFRWGALAWLLPLLASAQTPETPPEPEPEAAVVEQPAAPPPAQVGVRAAEIAAWLPPDQLLWLEAEGDRFPARLRTELTGSARGAVVILHDAGQHPSWPATLAALFDELPRHGWHALAVALPPPATLSSSAASNSTSEPAEPEAAEDETAATGSAGTAPNAVTVTEPAPPPDPAKTTDPAAVATATPAPAEVPATPPPPVDPEQQSRARVAAAIAHLATEQQTTAVTLVGFGNGALRAVRFAADPALRDSTAALVLVDFPVQEPVAAAESAHLLAEVALPTLDIRQGEDALADRQARERREATLRQRDRLHTQLQLPALAAPTEAAATPLVRRLRGWLQRYLDE